MHLSSDAKILIVDDMTAMRTALRRAFVQMGCRNIVEAADGAEAFAALEANDDTALVISDWNMEPMDDLALLAAVRAAVRLQELPFILMSSEADQRLRDKASAVGASLVLQKPFDVEVLRKAIDELVAPKIDKKI